MLGTFSLLLSYRAFTMFLHQFYASDPISLTIYLPLLQVQGIISLHEEEQHEDNQTPWRLVITPIIFSNWSITPHGDQQIRYE